ncbi:hypothetical protein vseg_003410 [Gypsophila vaccaria]
MAEVRTRADGYIREEEYQNTFDARTDVGRQRQETTVSGNKRFGKDLHYGKHPQDKGHRADPSYSPQDRKTRHKTMYEHYTPLNRSWAEVYALKKEYKR